MQNVILAVLAGIVFIYVVVVEVLDWAGRIDYLASKFPRITRFLDRLVESKTTRLALLGLAFLLLLRVSYELATTPRDVSPSTPSTSAPTNIEEVNQLRQQVRTLEADKAVKERAIETLGLVSVNPVRGIPKLKESSGRVV